MDEECIIGIKAKDRQWVLVVLDRDVVVVIIAGLFNDSRRSRPTYLMKL